LQEISAVAHIGFQVVSGKSDISLGRCLSRWAPPGQESQDKKESSFSEEKEAKILLSICAMRNRHTPLPNGQKFFASFFQKRSASFLPT
jgi:hypothetical protein